MHPLVPALAELAAAHPGAMVRFVARELPFAREILREVARARGALAGWEGTTLRQFAGELAAPALDADGLRPGDDLSFQAAADDALDSTASGLPAPLKRQIASLGFRTAAFDAFAQLRVAGVTPERLREAAREGSPAQALAPAYARYCAILKERRIGDAADAFRAAIAALPGGLADGELVVIEPGAADVTGLPLELVGALRKLGAILPALPHARADWSAPGLKMTFVRAASPALEVREALRHALASGASWDQVELAASDIDTYGTALGALGDQLGIPCTLKEGVPIVRSRAGRALERYLHWLEEGLPATPMRQALEQGELRPPTGDVTAAEIARALRLAQIGWGRERWQAALARFQNGAWVRDRMHDRDGRDDAEDIASREERLTRTASASAALLERLVALMPLVPEPSIGGADAVRITTSALATHALGWLGLVAPAIESSGERHALERLRGRLEQLAEHEREERSFALALAELRQGIVDLRTFPSTDGARSRRISAPGAVHLTDISQAGCTGRPRLYLLGLDAERTSTAPSADPILDEETRVNLGSALPSFRERSARRERALFRALNGLGGDVWLSYAALGDGTGREASPAPFVLDAARHEFGRPGMTYDDFRAQLGEPAGAARGRAPLDGRDVWLRALARGADLADGRTQVLEAHPVLARGIALHAAAESPVLSEWHGIVRDAATKTGPFADPSRWTSPSSLELLAKCPLAWFYRYALHVQPPDDVEYDANEWLDARQHGSLLHAILERFVREWMPRQHQIADVAAAAALSTIVAAEIARQREEVPPPSELVFTQEREQLERSARHFLAQEREHADATWIAVEARFPAPGTETVFVTSDGTQLPIGGYIDRVDRLADGTLRIIDYKSGSSWRFRSSPKDAPLKGGRMLQPAIYAAGASQSLHAEVARFEYRFPRERDPYDRVALHPKALAAAPGIVTSLLSHLRTGDFVPTDDPSDCAYCDFRAICRVEGEPRDPDSPRARWGAEHGEAVPQYAELRRRRTSEGA